MTIIDNRLFSKEFSDLINELLETEDVKRLDEFSQHMSTSRLSHSLGVSYISFAICKKMGWDYRSAARAGLLHDLYHYDWRVEKQPEGNHAKAHPRVALRNAQRVAELNSIEMDAIVKHMWPLTIRFPRYKESYAVTLADKYCASVEVMNQLGIRFRRALRHAAV